MSNAHKPRMRVTDSGLVPSYSLAGRRPTNDGLYNVVSGLGTDRDKRTHSFFKYDNNYSWDWYELEAAYSSNWIARAIIDIPVEDATREWRDFSGQDVSEIKKAEKRIGVQQVIQEAFRWSGLYGGAAIVMITNQNLSQPFDIERVRVGDLKRLLVLDRRYIVPIDLQTTNPAASNFLLPENYMISGSSEIIHHSHVIRIPGARLPMAMKQANGGWDDSQLRKCLDDLKDAVSAKAGIAALIQEANVDIITREGLSDDLTTDQDGSIISRYQLFGQMKSMIRLGLLDSTESYDRKGASFGGLGEILSTLMEWTAGAAQIPMTRLFGIQAKGIGDSGEGDMRNYNNSIRSKQESEYRGVLEQLDEVVVRSALGYMPDDFEFEWNPLSQPSQNDVAQQQLGFAQADEYRLGQGAVTVPMIMRKLQANGDYPISDEDIAQAERNLEEERLGVFDPQEEPVQDDPNADA